MTGEMSNWHNIWKNKNKVENDMAFKDYIPLVADAKLTTPTVGLTTDNVD
jgi:hypothetical protein